MKQSTQNTFNGGLNTDLNPLTTPNNILTDCLNGTLITYNGNEFTLQNDMGNCKVERAKLTSGFLPLGMTEYGGIVYVASYNPLTGQGELGSFPSPERDFTTSDFTNQAPANFKTADFTVIKIGDEVENLQKIQKLSEPDLLQLHPGDKYVITYKITDVEVGDAPDDIDTVVKMDNFISKSPINRKLFKLKFYKLSDSNNLTEIDPTTITVKPDIAITDDDYTFFTETSKATLAIGLELENLDYFDSNVIDTSRRLDLTKKFVIEAVGYGESLNEFKGVKVELQKPEVNTFYLDKVGTNNKVSVEISDLLASADVKGSVTPYSAYCLFPKLKQTFDFKLATALSNGGAVTNIYKFLKVGASMRVEFDYKFEGNTGVDLYVEFYDPHSDYSVISIVDSPTYYSLNTVTAQLVNEPRTDVFDANTAGGTPETELTTINDPYFKAILSTSGKIRKIPALRANHFYIVRISGVENISPTETKYYDVYRAMYTSDIFNEDYMASASWSINDPRQDFANLAFKYTSINFDISLDPRTSVTSLPIQTESANSANYRYFSPLDGKLLYAAVTTNPNYIATIGNTDISYATEYNISATDILRVTPNVSDLFGHLKSATLDVEVSSLATEIVDENYDVTSNLDPQSTYSLITNKVNDGYFNLQHNLKTFRKLKGIAIPVGQSLGNLSSTPSGKVPLAMPVFKSNIGKALTTVGIYENSTFRTIRIQGTSHEGITYNYIGPPATTDDTQVRVALESFEGTAIHPTAYSAKLVGDMFSGETTVWRLTSDLQSRDRTEKRNNMGPLFKDGFMIMKTKSGLAWIWNKSPVIIERFLSNIEIGYRVDTILYAYAADPDTELHHGLIKTKGTHTVKVDVDLQSNGALFDFFFKSKNVTNDFINTPFINYINEKLGTNQLLETKINPEFFPISDLNFSFEKDLDALEINKEFDAQILKSIVTAKSDIFNSNMFDLSDNTAAHGVLTMKPGFTEYTELLPYFTVNPPLVSNGQNNLIPPEQLHLVLIDDANNIDTINMACKSGVQNRQKIVSNSDVMNLITEIKLNSIT